MKIKRVLGMLVIGTLLSLNIIGCNKTDNTTETTQDVENISLAEVTPGEDGEKKTKELVFEDAYVNKDTDVKESYDESSETLGTLKDGDKIKKAEDLSTGWSQIEYNGKNAYVKTTDITKE
ncbi:MAG: hypothetical protein GX275_09550 [Clostridiales bacterium]|nr:hypothetical protein [Clostridiales bacterium]